MQKTKKVTLEKLAVTIDQLAEKMDKGFSNIDQRFEKVDKRFIEMEQKLEKKIDDKIEDFAIIVKNEFDRAYNKLNIISSDVKNLKNNDKKLEKKQKNNSIRLVFLENGKRFMENEQDKIKARVSKLEAKEKMGT